MGPTHHIPISRNASLCSCGMGFETVQKDEEAEFRIVPSRDSSVYACDTVQGYKLQAWCILCGTNFRCSRFGK